ncbi:MAG: pantoate--beta-alanine ligase [Firmicutes bacterium]|jgi:pantoate--beta-alanine ligase|nr:pantoate--beta-alanine ligase [Bacillota bacterium]
MELLKTVSETRQFVASQKEEKRSIGLVPTMGYLHQGHLSLIHTAREQNDTVVVSIFVNPTQFGPQEDLDRYPRDLEKDCRLCTQAGVDAIFMPTANEMYPGRFLTWVQVQELTEVLCGASRPGHFRGVTTVVNKLFNIIQPDRAYFGLKDFQQAVVIKQMVQDLNIPVEIVAVPTVREADGLATSSRNEYLTPQERARATVLYRSLQIGRQLIEAGERNVHSVREAMVKEIERQPNTRIDYIAICDPSTLVPVDQIKNQVLLALAVWIGNTRLIDNVLVEV